MRLKEKIKEKVVRDYLFSQQNRDEWVKAKLRRLPEGLKLLDAGAGEQRYRQFCQHLDYTSQDFCQYDGKGDGKGLHNGKWDTSAIDIVGDIWNIDVSDQSFDVVLCTEVFEHILYPIETVKEFCRILKKGGVLILTAPFCSLTHFSPYHYYTGFTRYWYQSVLEDNGFTVESIEPSGNYFSFVAQEVLRTIKEVPNYTNKRMNLLDLLAITKLATKMKRLNKKKNNADELGCMGFHVIARKK